ncbi:alpha/beta fold hydrolase [Halobacterium jilantaiense]|uniref:Pimeloyl-ACP methyl ester carboxylesterase n=1 Tax=Halobacterium jilantaiense TaxID=355548 RepID=A0A1I0PMK6_9EURY|nr:alpha/beta hydrolase [Halobacterium jilantaiense]SEW15630.1 Pimeloyl-ACP methyl ester carboxylesterase [Halobacterium jilantaiense]
MSAPGQQRRATAEQPDSDDHRTVRVDGHRVAYAAFGDHDGEPVVAFHGTPGSRLFGRLYDAPARERGVRLLAFDRPGYGASARWPDYAAADAPRVVDAVLADSGVDAAGLLAFSGGTAHALAAAGSDPERFDDVTVVSGAAPPAHVSDQPTPQRVLGALAAHTPRLLGGLLRAQAWAAGRADPDFVAAQYTTDGTDHLPADVLDGTRRDFLEALSGGAGGLVRESAQAVREWPVALGDATGDVYWFHGREDANVPVDAARSVTDALPHATLDLVDTDHLGAVAATRSRVLARHA